MGLGIHICTNNDIDSFDSERGICLFQFHALSRTFCNLMLQKQESQSGSEFDKIEKVTGVKLKPICSMNAYPDQELHRYQLEQANSNEERKMLNLEMEEQLQSLNNNLNGVLNTVSLLINALNSISNLANLVQTPSVSSMIPMEYYTNFPIDTGEGYVNNNLGQDLRNLKRFLEFAKINQTHTVWFEYG